jgi:hypothetical protein
MPPNPDIVTTTNQYLAPAWVDQILRDNRFFAAILEKKTTKKWDGSQMLFPKLIQVLQNLTRISKKLHGELKSFLIYGENLNYALVA